MEIAKASSNVRRRQTGLPPEFTRLPMRMVRAATAADVYAHPRAELVRLTDLGLLHRVATGFYVAAADDNRRPIAHDRISETTLAEEVVGDLPRSFAEVLAHMDTRKAPGEWDCITGEVEAIAGRPPRSFESFAQAHREQLLSSVRA